MSGGSKHSAKRRKWDYYGKIQCVKNPAAATIWRSRDEELPDCEPFGMSSDYEVDPWSFLDDKEFLTKLMEKTPHAPIERRVLAERFFCDQTLEEVGKRYGVSRERVRQIETKALRKMRVIAYKEFKQKYWRYAQYVWCINGGGEA